METIRALNIEGLELHSFPKTVPAHSELFARSADCFPRPGDHIVIADYLIELPVVAVDLNPASEHYGRVLGYCSGSGRYKFWKIADSLSELGMPETDFDRLTMRWQPA